MKNILIQLACLLFVSPVYSSTFICKTDGYLSSSQIQTSPVNKRKDVSITIDGDKIEMVDIATKSKNTFKLLLGKIGDGYVGVHVPPSNLEIYSIDSIVITINFNYRRVVRTITMSDGAEIYFYNC